MSVSPTAVVNQRLYYCRLHLDWLASIATVDAAPAAFYAAEESLVYHLVMAYRAYLAELADKFACIAEDVSTAAELAAMMADKGYRPSELEQLLVLEATASWLSGLQACYQSRAIIDSELTSHRGDIKIISSDSELGGKAKVNCQEVFEHLKTLIESQRATMEEW